MCAN